MKNLSYFRSSFLFTFFGLIASFFVGRAYGGTLSSGLEAVFLVAILGILEISLSFDNAVVNAKILNKMPLIWRHRFLTWGMLIAVFGMRIVFPLGIVSIMGSISPLEALRVAIYEPETYSRIMLAAHVPIAAFGGAFLSMVALKYFFDANKEVHWFQRIEKPLTYLGKLEAVEAAFVLLLIFGFSHFLHDQERMNCLASGILGVVTYILVDGLSSLLQDSEKSLVKSKVQAGLAAFIYLEILDASFSFDGVIGAFALSNNLFLIAIGLGIGAVFVRSITILLVEKNSLAHFKFLEHGAFYAILCLAIIMFVGILTPVPEVITGLLGAGFIGLSIWSSILDHRKTQGG